MNIGKQSTLNDLQSIDEKASTANSKANEIKKEIEKVGLSKRVQPRYVSDMHSFYENGRFTVNLKGMKNKPPTSLPLSSNWFYLDMKLHSHSNGYALSEVTEFHRDRKFFRRQSGVGDSVNHGVWVEYLTTANTLVDANGFIKAA